MDLERHIDDAARRLTMREPERGLRARVMARIGTEHVASRRPWRLVLATAGIVIAAVLWQAPARRVTPGIATASLLPPVSTAVPNAPAAGSVSLPVIEEPVSWAVEAMPVSAPASVAPLPPLARAEAASFIEIQPAALTIPLLDVKPLGTPPMSVEPIDLDSE